MKSFLISILFLSSLLCCPFNGQASDLDPLLRQLIVGSWAEGTSPYGIVTFAADGNYRVILYASEAKKELLLEIKGTWQIVDGELRSLLLEASSTKAPVGEEFVDKIVQLNHDELVMIGVDGEKYSKYRIKD